MNNLTPLTLNRCKRKSIDERDPFIRTRVKSSTLMWLFEQIYTRAFATLTKINCDT